ncbi:MAG: hypothetical protein ACP5M4_01665 [Acidobacteriaceae bacterium]
MFRRNSSIRLSFAAALAIAFAALLVPHAAQAQISKTAMAGPYSVNLKILPAEGFMGMKAPMQREGGAMPEMVNGATHPNHHMVVFIKKDGKPVEHAHVKIWYRMSKGEMMDNNKMGGMMDNKMGEMKGMNHWMTLPVTRMEVRGKGPATTHFGNNVHLMDGSYEVKVSVNGKVAMFHFSL